MVVVLAIIFWLSFFLLAWTYFGYPILMYIWAKVYAKPITKQDITPALTLLIPAHNEADVIESKVKNSLSLTYPKDKLQILVIDDGSQDGTAEIVERYADQGVTLIRQKVRGGKMGAVNTGFQNATGEIVVLSDASPAYEKDSLQILVRGFADPSVGVIVGTLAIWDTDKGVAKSAGMYWKYEAALRRWESKTGSTVAVHGNMFAIRRELHRPLITGTINDEFSLAMETIRQGYRVTYEPDAISYDDASSNMQDEFNRRARINAGRFQSLFNAGYLKAPNLNIAFRLFSHKLLRPLSPIFMLLMLPTNLINLLLPAADGNAFLMLQKSGGLLIWVGQLAFYFLAYLGWMAEKRGAKRSILTSIPYFFVSSNMSALVGMWRWLRGSQKVTWKKRTSS